MELPDLNEFEHAKLMLGVEVLPEKLADLIYQSRVCLNRLHGGQDLGLDTIAILCAPFRKPADVDLDGLKWADTPEDGSVRVEWVSKKQEGVYLGMHGKKLKVKFPDDDKEFRTIDQNDAKVVK